MDNVIVSAIPALLQKYSGADESCLSLFELKLVVLELTGEEWSRRELFELVLQNSDKEAAETTTTSRISRITCSNIAHSVYMSRDEKKRRAERIGILDRGNKGFITFEDFDKVFKKAAPSLSFVNRRAYFEALDAYSVGKVPSLTFFLIKACVLLMFI